MCQKYFSFRRAAEHYNAFKFKNYLKKIATELNPVY